MADLSHLSATGKAAMVDVSDKDVTTRVAQAAGEVTLTEKIPALADPAAREEVVRTARLAGIQGAKLTAQLVPLCHPLSLTRVDVRIEYDAAAKRFLLLSETKTKGQTGVEMEALTAVQVAALTLYDMIKAADPAATVGPFRVLRKEGGKTGLWTHPKQ